MFRDFALSRFRGGMVAVALSGFLIAKERKGENAKDMRMAMERRWGRYGSGRRFCPARPVVFRDFALSRFRGGMVAVALIGLLIAKERKGENAKGEAKDGG